MLKVQEFLANNTLVDLERAYAIKAKRGLKHPNLVSLKYSMIESPMHERIVQECRGIILDEADNWKVVCRGFDKFFNYGEGHAANIDWRTARVQEKVDGSLMMLYFYKGEWHVASSGTPDAYGNIQSSVLTFADYFWQIYGTLGPDDSAQKYVHFFEMTGPLNRVVIPHQEASLTLLGGRRVDTWEEVHPNEISVFHDHRVVKETSLSSMDDIMKTFSTISPLVQEGYVVVDANFNRVKVKHPGYVALHHAKDGLSSTKSFVEIARSGEIPEVLVAFPEYKPMLDEAKLKLDALIAELQVVYDEAKDIPVQKDFALKVKGCKCSAAMFALRSKQCESLKEYFATARIESLMVLLGLKENNKGKPEE